MITTPPPAPRKPILQQLLQELGIGPKPQPQGTPPLVAPQNQNPMQSPVQTAAPSVARATPPPNGSPPPPPKGFPASPPMGNANPVNQVLPPAQNPGASASGMVPKAVAAQYAKNQKTQVKRDIGSKLLQKATTPPPPPAQQPVQYQQPNKALEYLGAGLALLFGGSRAGALGAAIPGALNQRADTNYQRALQQRQQEIAAEQAGYNFQTGQPIAPPPIPPSLQRIVPGHVGPNYKPTTDDIVNHYMAVASWYAQRPDPASQAQAKTYTALANAAAAGYEKIQQGNLEPSKAQELQAQASYYKDRNRTMLLATDERTRAQAELQAKRLANSQLLAGMRIGDADARQQIALRAGLYMAEYKTNAEAALRIATTEYTTEAAKDREQASLQAANGATNASGQTVVPSVQEPNINIFNGIPQQPQVPPNPNGSGTPPPEPHAIPKGAYLSPDGKQYWFQGHTYDAATGQRVK